MPGDLSIDPDHGTDRIRVDYAHIGLFDVQERRLWIARPAQGLDALRLSHARLLRDSGGGAGAVTAHAGEVSTVEKDRFVCYWFHTPHTGQGYVQGYPIEWEEGHLIVRLEPNWNYLARKFIPPTDTARIEKNIEQQYAWARRIFDAYVARRPSFALSWHMIGPRATDSMFYIRRVEG